MTVPAAITSELAALQAQVAAAAPLTSASAATVLALQLNAAQLVTDVDAALAGAAGQLDTWIAPADPDQIVAGVTALVDSVEDQSSLADTRGLVGRVAANLEQL